MAVPSIRGAGRAEAAQLQASGEREAGPPFVTDAYARRVLGWRAGTTMSTQLVLDALEQAIWTRQRVGNDVGSVVAHSDRGLRGGFNWSSQHLDHGGVWWRVQGSRGRSFRQVRGGQRGCGSCVAAGDAVTGPAGAVSGGAARVLAAVSCAG
jgi:hypothetical protein